MPFTASNSRRHRTTVLHPPVGLSDTTRAVTVPTRQAPAKTRSRAFTLVEVVVGILLFAVFAVGICQTMLYAGRITEANLRATVARDVAQSILEQTRNVPCSALRNNTTFVCDIFGTNFTLTKGTSRSVSVEYRAAGATKISMTVNVNLTTTVLTPPGGEAITVAVDYSWRRLREGTDRLLSGKLAYVKSDFRD